MAELSIITNQIAEEAARAAEEIRQKAQAEYAEIVDALQKQAKQEAAEITENARCESERLTTRAISASAQKRAQAVLALKNEWIAQTAQKAMEQVLRADDVTYMAYMEKLLDKHMGAAPGEILMNKRDKSRMSDSFRQKIKAAGLTVSAADADIQGGFVLKYGAVEENCAIEALFREKREALTDCIGAQLF